MNALEQFSPVVGVAGRIGQGTEVEKARAATEVQAAIYIARQFPRDIAAARNRMLAACAQKELAEKAFYAFSRGDGAVTGMTIDVACEIAQCWGNIDYGLKELIRDDAFGQSEMFAYAWDLETNVRIGSTFIVPHKRDTKRGVKALVESRDIYENNTNNGNRRMRAAIFKALPTWYVSQTEAALRATLQRIVSENEKTIGQQIDEAVAGFGAKFDLTAAQLEDRVGRPKAKWTENDLVQLRITWKSLERGELRIDEAFPSAKVTAAEVIGAKNTATPPAEASAGYVSHLHPDECAEHAEDDWDADCGSCVAASAARDRAAVTS